MTRQTEPEWDPVDRENAEGLHQFDAEVCPGCRLHPATLDGAAVTFEDRLCDICAAQAKYGRMLSEADEKWHNTHENPSPRLKQPEDGRHTFLRLMTPEEVAERRRTDGGSSRSR